MSSPKVPTVQTSNQNLDPASEYFYTGNTLTSQRVFDPATRSYTSRLLLTPQEQQMQDAARAGLNQVLEQAQQINVTPEQMDTYKQQLMTPQINALDREYGNLRRDAIGQANASGMLNSVGFERFRANELDRNKAEQLANIEANAETGKYQLPMLQMQPLAQMANFYGGILGNQQQANIANIDPAMQGSNATNKFFLDQRQTLENAALQRAGFKAQNKGFFGRLFGG